MSAIVTTKCCCPGPGTDLIYWATKCPQYKVNQCVEDCGDCCDGPDPPSTIYLCSSYLYSINFDPLSFNSSFCYYVSYRDCIYVIDQQPKGDCPSSPPFPQPYNVGGYYDIKPAAGLPCCRPSGPVVPCVDDLIVESFSFKDPWGITNPVQISSQLEACAVIPGTLDICGSNADEWISGGQTTFSANTTQLVGKCWERENPDTTSPTGPCDRSPGGAVYLDKIGTLGDSEDWDPCNCEGTPGGVWYQKSVQKCYAVNECADSKCWGYCDDPVGYAACIANRNAVDICNGIPDPTQSYTLDTRYTIIKSCSSYSSVPGSQPCLCDLYEDDALRISFPLCFAVSAGYDPTNPSNHAAIKDFYKNKIAVQNFCEGTCKVNVGPPYGNVPLDVTCVDVCGYKVAVFSGSAGHIAAKINSKMGPDITASSLNQWFWFGWRQNSSDCSPTPAPNQRPPFGPGDVLIVDRTEIDIGAWRARVFLKGRSPKFRYCVSQVLASNSSTGQATCMSSNAVSPAEWAAGMRPDLVMVRTGTDTTTTRCQCDTSPVIVDCSDTGTYPQNTTTVGLVITPGYVDQLFEPCGTQWKVIECNIPDCCKDACTCDECDDCLPCCNCSFGINPSNCPCIGHKIKGDCGCSIPANQQITILP